MEKNEAELIARIKSSRDMEAFHDLVCIHQQRLYALIVGLVRNHQDGQDLLQETFLKSLRSIDQLRENDRFGPWISRIAVNTALNFKQEQSRRQNLAVDEVDRREADNTAASGLSGEDPIRELQAAEIRGRLDMSLRRLPKNYRTAFVLFHQNGLRVSEISEITGWNEVTVRTYVFRAVRKLRGHLREYYEALKE